MTNVRCPAFACPSFNSTVAPSELCAQILYPRSYSARPSRRAQNGYSPLVSHAKHSHPKKVALPKGALLLKLLSAFCVINSVGAAAVPGLLDSPSPTCGCSEEIEALQEEIGAKEVAHTAAIYALNQY